MTRSSRRDEVPAGQPATFTEGSTYLVRRLQLLDGEGHVRSVERPAVIFSAGWIYIQEDDAEGYVVPRERVLLVEGVKRPRLRPLNDPAP